MPKNKVEDLKTARDGLDILTEISRWAREGVEAIPDDDLERLKWFGLFHRKATPGYFMLRIRIPNGTVTVEQVRAIAEISERCGRGHADNRPGYRGRVRCRAPVTLRTASLVVGPPPLFQASRRELTRERLLDVGVFEHEPVEP